MPNSILLEPSSSITAVTSKGGVTRTSLPGCQWRPKLDVQRFGFTTKSSDSLSSTPTGSGRQSVIVRGFFGGSKTPPIKSAGKGCVKCLGKGAVDCAGCKGTGKNKKNGNMFERWKCFDCQGFGLVACPNCGTGGLTPEQRRER